MLGNIFILGDSYSTFEGYIPDGYSHYYHIGYTRYIEKDPSIPVGENDVVDVTQTWWYNLAVENGTLLRNCSWSGTTVCHTSYGGEDCSDISFIGRIEKLIEAKYFENNRVDTLFLFGGTNDSWADSPLGEEKYSDWTDEDLYYVRPGFSYLLDILIKNIPGVKIYCILNTDLKTEITDFFKSACERRGVGVIELCDIEKVYNHPTVRGMASIKKQVLDYIRERQ